MTNDRPRRGRGLEGLSERAIMVTLARDAQGQDEAGYVAALQRYAVEARERVRLPGGTWCRP